MKLDFKEWIAKVTEASQPSQPTTPTGFGTSVNIAGYTSSNMYTVPSNGIVTASLYFANGNYIAVNVSSVEVIRLANCNGVANMVSSNTVSFPVYKGQQVYVTRSGPNASYCTAYFRPYTY